MSKLITSRPVRSAFTLIELLVVIAIIAILAAILFPVFGRARENARRSSCLSNMKQIGLGMMQYLQDYDEKYPLAFWKYQADANGYQQRDDERGWAYNMQPYLKSRQIFQCPSDTIAPPTDAQVTDVLGQHYRPYTDYAYNRDMGNPVGGPGSTPAVISASQLTFSANTVMLVEITGGPSGTSQAGGPGGGISGTSGLAQGRVDSAVGKGALQRHLDGSNITFTDGHAKWFKGSSHSSYANVYNEKTPVTASNASFSID